MTKNTQNPQKPRAAFRGSSSYVATDDLQVAVNASIALERPLLVKGEPGTGKTVLAEEVASALNTPLITWHIKSTTKAHQGLYEYDAITRLRDSQLGDKRVQNIQNYIKHGKLWEAFQAPQRPVLLIDEIDKADIEFPNDLLLELDRMEFFVPELNQTVKADTRPLVFITSNNEKELPDAFLRRCFFHYIQFPNHDVMQKIIDVHFPNIKKRLVSEALKTFYEIRETPGLKKKPSTSELLDWLKLLLVEDVDPETLREKNPSKAIPPLHGALLKNEQDVQLFERLAFLARREARDLSVFIQFFHDLKDAKLPVSLREYLTLMEALDADVIQRSPEQFYYLSRSALVKDERNLDKFDQVFSKTFKGLETLSLNLNEEIPQEWLKNLAQKYLSDEEKEQIKALGGWDEIMKTLQKRLEEQKKRHQGGSKWIGTGGTSPYGAGGYNPEGVRFGDDGERQQRAVKVWGQRQFKNLSHDVEIGVRNVKIALRRLRRFARDGADEELDLDATISSTAKKGWLDVQLVPERRNAVKVLLLLDIGGSMDPHIKACAELFSAAKSEFKHIEHFYFHNCPYETAWKDNTRRARDVVQTWDILHTYPADYKVVFVGDASMSPYEIAYPGGSVEHWNEEPGALWLQRFVHTYQSAVWLNPLPSRHWEHTPSIQMIRDVFSQRMFPLTLAGIDEAMKELARD